MYAICQYLVWDGEFRFSPTRSPWFRSTGNIPSVNAILTLSCYLSVVYHIGFFGTYTVYICRGLFRGSEEQGWRMFSIEQTHEGRLLWLFSLNLGNINTLPNQYCACHEQHIWKGWWLMSIEIESMERARVNRLIWFRVSSLQSLRYIDFNVILTRLVICIGVVLFPRYIYTWLKHENRIYMVLKYRYIYIYSTPLVENTNDTWEE